MTISGLIVLECVCVLWAAFCIYILMHKEGGSKKSKRNHKHI